MMYGKWILAGLCIAASGVVSAQSLAAYKEQLATAVSSNGHVARVRVTEYGDAARAVADAARNSQRQRVRGYRVCIYFDNGQSGQDARGGAVAAKALFEERFPDEKVYMVYENPYFKVSVGNCLTDEEAIILKGRVSGVFPKAFLKREEFALSDLLN